jgi:hypothetical protein
MTLLGKILTMLILIMSVLFFAMSLMVFATHKNWKEFATNTDPAKLGLVQKLQQANERLDKANKELQSLKNTLAAESAARRYALAALQSKATQYEELIATTQKKLDELMAAHAQAAQALATSETTKEALTKEVEKLRGEIRTAQQSRDELFEKIVVLTDSLNQNETLRNSLEQRGKQLADQVTRMKVVMDAKGLREDTLVSHIPPQVEGKVLKVGAKDLLVISLGADVGLKVGHVMDVYRGTSYLGRIIIRETKPDQAVGQIIKEMQRGTIQQGDNVTTKLS